MDVENSDYKHAVAIMFDPHTNRLIYQNPTAQGMPEYLKAFFQDCFPSMTVTETKVRQQDDDYSCSYFAFYNLLCMAYGKPLLEKIDVLLLRKKIDMIAEEMLSLDSDVDMQYATYS